MIAGHAEVELVVTRQGLGRRTGTLDSKDEPASALLERLRTQRAQSPPQRRRSARYRGLRRDECGGAKSASCRDESRPTGNTRSGVYRLRFIPTCTRQDPNGGPMSKRFERIGLYRVLGYPPGLD